MKKGGRWVPLESNEELEGLDLNIQLPHGEIVLVKVNRL